MAQSGASTTVIQDHLDRAGVQAPNIHAVNGAWPCTIVWTYLRGGMQDLHPTQLFNLFIPTRTITLHEITGVLGRKNFKYSPGKVGFSPSQNPLTLEWLGTLESYTFFFEAKTLAKAAMDCFGETFDALTWRDAKGDFAPAIAYLGLDIAGQVATGYPAGQAHVDEQMKTLLSMILRRYASTPDRDTALVGLYSGPVLRAVQFINANLGQDFTLTDVSKNCGASITHLRRLFRSEMGDSVWSYVQKRRLAAAAKALINSDTPIAQIGRDHGYKDAKHFSRQFKTHYGVSPKKYVEEAN